MVSSPWHAGHTSAAVTACVPVVSTQPEKLAAKFTNSGAVVADRNAPSITNNACNPCVGISPAGARVASHYPANNSRRDAAHFLAPPNSLAPSGHSHSVRSLVALPLLLFTLMVSANHMKLRSAPPYGRIVGSEVSRDSHDPLLRACPAETVEKGETRI